MRVTPPPAPFPFVRLARLAALGVSGAAVSSHRFFSAPGVPSTSLSSSGSSSCCDIIFVNRVERDVDPTSPLRLEKAVDRPLELLAGGDGVVNGAED